MVQVESDVQNSKQDSGSGGVVSVAVSLVISVVFVSKVVPIVISVVISVLGSVVTSVVVVIVALTTWVWIIAKDTREEWMKTGARIGNSTKTSRLMGIKHKYPIYVFNNKNNILLTRFGIITIKVQKEWSIHQSQSTRLGMFQDKLDQR